MHSLANSFRSGLRASARASPKERPAGAGRGTHYGPLLGRQKAIVSAGDTPARLTGASAASAATRARLPLTRHTTLQREWGVDAGSFTSAEAVAAPHEKTPKT
jgi:hypothetical protein